MWSTKRKHNLKGNPIGFDILLPSDRDNFSGLALISQ